MEVGAGALGACPWRFASTRLYATWLASDGVPVTLVHHALGHEQASTRLDRYTYAASGHGDRLSAVFADSVKFRYPLDERVPVPP